MADIPNGLSDRYVVTDFGDPYDVCRMILAFAMEYTKPIALLGEPDESPGKFSTSAHALLERFLFVAERLQEKSFLLFNPFSAGIPNGSSREGFPFPMLVATRSQVGPSSSCRNSVQSPSRLGIAVFGTVTSVRTIFSSNGRAACCRFSHDRVE